MSTERYCDAEAWNPVAGEVRNPVVGGQGRCGRLAKVKAVRRLDDGPEELYYTMAYCARHLVKIHDIPEGVSQGEVMEIVT